MPHLPISIQLEIEKYKNLKTTEVVVPDHKSKSTLIACWDEHGNLTIRHKSKLEDKEYLKEKGWLDENGNLKYDLAFSGGENE